MIGRLIIIVFAISGIGFLVFIHEFGHFIAAKLFGMKVREANIGFGPKLVKKLWGETEYGISVFPLGGYVRLAGMEPDEDIEPEDSHRAFDVQPILKRLTVIFLGPLMNLLITIPLFSFMIYSTGISNPTTTIDEIAENSVAAKVGIKPGDKIININNKNVNKWDEVLLEIAPNYGKQIKIIVKRREEKLTFYPKASTKKVGSQKKGFLGIVSRLHVERLSVPDSIAHGTRQTYVATKAMAKALASIFTGGIPVKTVVKGSAGPIGIATILVQVANRGIIDYLFWIAVISINLAIINLFPLPPLDGGRIAFLIYEAVRGKPVSRERMVQLQTIGMALLIFLISVLIISDISKFPNYIPKDF